MKDQSDSLNASNKYFDPHNEPRLPLGDWHLPAAPAARSGDSAYSEPGASDSRELPASGSDAAWDPPKFDEPRTIPGGWDLSALK